MLASGREIFGTVTIRDRVTGTTGRFGAAGLCATTGFGFATGGGGGGCRVAGGTITIGIGVTGPGGVTIGIVRTPSQPVPAGFIDKCTCVEAAAIPPQAYVKSVV